MVSKNKAKERGGHGGEMSGKYECDRKSQVKKVKHFVCDRSLSTCTHVQAR